VQVKKLKPLSSLRLSKTNSVALLFLCSGLFLFCSFILKDGNSFSDNLNNFVVKKTEEARRNIDSISLALIQNKRKKAIYFYENSRKAYKQIEFYIEYHFPFHSKYFINSALVNKAEVEYGYKTFSPHGYQIIESYLYAEQQDDQIYISHELDLLKQSLLFVKEKSEGKINKPATTVDMLRFEIVRIMSLYLNGYDCTVNKQNLVEITNNLEGIEATLSLFEYDLKQKSSAFKHIKLAKAYLAVNKNYEEFDRLFFITRYMTPLYEELYKLYSVQEASTPTLFGINIRDKRFYDDNWFNVNYFSVVLKDSAFAKEQAELGKLLFFDPILSGNNKRACASCHDPSNAFGGSTTANSSFDYKSKLTRNTPSLVNAFIQKNFFYDGRSLQLEDQASDVLLNHLEMNASPEDIVKKLRLSNEYKTHFKRAFKNTEDTAITYYAVLKAISEFERRLSALNSRFDKYLRGDTKQLSQDEIKGYTVFAGKALCGSCHFFPLFNGLTPPFYSENEYEVIGTPSTKQNKELSSDSGRYLISKNKIHLHAFKTPGIRNLDRIAPYMHNGVYTTIDEVIEFYRKGGGAGLGLNLSNQTLPFDSLTLTKNEVKQLKQFLLCLSDSSHRNLPPKKLPYIKGYENRKLGGEY
jgi:cytochrome c peroxidase